MKKNTYNLIFHLGIIFFIGIFYWGGEFSAFEVFVTGLLTIISANIELILQEVRNNE